MEFMDCETPRARWLATILDLHEKVSASITHEQIRHATTDAGDDLDGSPAFAESFDNGGLIRVNPSVFSHLVLIPQMAIWADSSLRSSLP